MTPLRLRDVPARRGTHWVREGFRVLFRQPLPLAGLFSAGLLGGLLLGAMPLALQLLTLTLAPLVTLVFMTLTRSIVEQRGSVLAAIAEPFRAGPRTLRALAALGVAYMLGCLAIVGLGALLDGGALAELMEAMRRGAPQEEIAAKAGDPLVLLGLVVRLSLAAALSVPFWYAPALVHWAGQGVLQSLFSSTLAVWRNKTAFTIYGLTWGWVTMLVSIVCAVLFSALGLGSSPAMPLMPSLLAGTAFYASLWFTFADCFDSAPTTTQETPP